MNKAIISLMLFLSLSWLTSWAGDKEERIGAHAGFLFPSTLNASIAYEHDLAYGKAFDLFGEIGNHWQTPTCHRFWKGNYWDFGAGYKIRLRRYKNSLLRLRMGGQLGAVRGEFFLGCNLSLEYDYVFASGIHFCITQKNDFNFLHGDHFRNGLTLGVKFPI